MITRGLYWRYWRRRLNLQNHRIQKYFWSPVIFTAVTSILVMLSFFNNAGDLWYNYKIAFGNAYSYCEFNHFDELIRQRVNTWSNLGFFLVGLFCLTLGIHDLKYQRNNTTNLFVKYPVFSIMMGISCIYLFIGSFFYHASLIHFFQKMDITGIYALMFTIIAFNIFLLVPKIKSRTGQWISSHKMIVWSVVILNIVFYIYFWKLNINILFPSIVVMTFILMYFANRQSHKAYTKYFRIAIVFLLAAGSIWIMDVADLICAPNSLLQGHALWHVLCAASTLFLYMYYRSDNSVSMAELRELS